MKRLEQAAHDYWCVGTALRNPDAPAMTCGDALKRLNSSDRLRPEEWKLADNMHVVRFDIIEGNTEWREKIRVPNSKLIPFTTS